MRRLFAGWYNKNYPHTQAATEAIGYTQFQLEWRPTAAGGHHGNPWQADLNDEMFWL